MSVAVNLVPQASLTRQERARRTRFWCALNALLGAAILSIALVLMLLAPGTRAETPTMAPLTRERRQTEARLVTLATRRDQLIELAKEQLALNGAPADCVERLVRFMNAAPDSIRLLEIHAQPREVTPTPTSNPAPVAKKSGKRGAQPPAATPAQKPAPPKETFVLEIHGLASTHDQLRQLIDVAQSDDGWKSVRLQRATSEATERGGMAFVLECAPQEARP